MTHSPDERVDADGYPVLCSRCGRRVLKNDVNGSIYLYDHVTGVGSTRHVRCPQAA